VAEATPFQNICLIRTSCVAITRPWRAGSAWNKQIPCGDDSKKSKGNRNDKSGFCGSHPHFLDMRGPHLLSNLPISCLESSLACAGFLLNIEMWGTRAQNPTGWDGYHVPLIPYPDFQRELLIEVEL